MVVQTKIFPTEPEGDLELCKGQPGSAFAAYLTEELEKIGYKCDPLIQEDYGWGFWIGKNDLTVWVAVSYACGDGRADEAGRSDEDGPVGDNGGQWYVTAAYEVPFLVFRPKFWFKGKDGGSLESEIYSRLKDALAANPEIRIIREE